MNFWEQFVLSIFTGLLHGLVRNPKTAAPILNVIVDIHNDTGTVLASYGYTVTTAVAPAAGASMPAAPTP